MMKDEKPPARARVPIWYKNSESLKSTVSDLRLKFEGRCRELGLSPFGLQSEIWADLIARAVHESNWQEGIELDEPRTREIVFEVFQLDAIQHTPAIDISAILGRQRRVINEMRRHARSVEEIATFNLACAHTCIKAIIEDVQYREIAHLQLGLEAVRDAMRKSLNQEGEDAEQKIKLEEIETLLTESEAKAYSIGYESTTKSDSGAEYLSKLRNIGLAGIKVLPVEYVHFLHSVSMMSVLHYSRVGRFRNKPVHVGREDVLFPPYKSVPALMDEFCKDLGRVIANSSTRDMISLAAKMSYRFVAIHPYSDGNGRVSRLIMNLVLGKAGYPPIYLKADNRGRHMYSMALRRANRGDLQGLQSLIAKSLISVYERVLGSLGRH